MHSRSEMVLHYGNRSFMPKQSDENLTLYAGYHELFVKMLTGKTLCVPFSSDYSIGDLKQAIDDREGIPPTKQRLIYAGKQLEDMRKLLGVFSSNPYYNLSDGAIRL